MPAAREGGVARGGVVDARVVQRVGARAQHVAERSEAGDLRLVARRVVAEQERRVVETGRRAEEERAALERRQPVAVARGIEAAEHHAEEAAARLAQRGPAVGQDRLTQARVRAAHLVGRDQQIRAGLRRQHGADFGVELVVMAGHELGRIRRSDRR